MQLLKLHKHSYTLSRIACTAENQEKYLQERKKHLGDWDLLKKRKVPDKEIAKITGISRATYYRRKKAIELFGIEGLKLKSKRPKRLRKSKIPIETINLILKLRKENPTYGKAKLAVLLIRDHNVKLSESSVGRILKQLMLSGKIKKSRSAGLKRRKRKFNQHAQRWRYGMQIDTPGQLVQIDHMSVTKNNIHMKHFQAWDPKTKFTTAEVCTNATSAAASKFLHKVIEKMPFKIKSIQVDGGSEFMRHFEQECEKLGIELYVLPPKRPQYNGGVERANRTFREEFYAQEILAESIGAFKVKLNQAVDKYNSYRPHFSLHGLTPLQYTQLLLEDS